MSRPWPEGRLGRLGPLAQRALGLGQQVERARPAARSGPGRCRVGRRSANRWSECSAWSRSKSGGGVAGRSTPASGSRTPTASPAKRMPLAESCSATWCLAWPGESTAISTRSGPDPDLLAVGQHVDPLGRGRVEPAVERVEQGAVDPGGRVHQAGRVGQVPGPLLVHVDGGAGEGPGHVAHPAGVVEVDVGDHHPGQIDGPEAQAGRARPGAPAPTTGSRSPPAPAPGPRSGSRPSPAASRRAGCRSRRTPGAIGGPPPVTPATSTTTFTSSGWRSSACGHWSRGTFRLTTLASQARSALASAWAPAS